MLSFPIKSIREANEGSSILLFSWDEMFSPDAPDTYQPKLLHVPALVEEIENIAARAVKSQKWERHLRLLQEELKFQCEYEKEFLTCVNNKYCATLEQLVSEQNVTDIRAISKLLETQCENFNRQAVCALELAGANLPGKKELAMEALKRVGTIALRSGRTQEDYKHIFTEPNLTKPPSDIISKIVEASNPIEQSYTCILAVQGTKEELQIIARKAKFTILTKKNFPSGDHSTEFCEITQNNVWLSISERGTKAIEAARDAIRRIRTAIDIFNFYRHASFSFRDEVLVFDANGKSVLLRPRQEWSWQKRSKRSAKLLSKQLIGEAEEKRFSGRILNALEHYSLAQTSAAARIKLVNLWSALECLTSREDASSTMEGVCKSVVPIVTWRRTSKILSYTSKLLTEHQSLTGGKLGAGFPEEEKGISNERLLLALAKEEGHPHLEQLSLFTKDNAFLRNRIFTLWKIFSRPQALASELKLTAKRVDWHLYRIYRARNLIVHEGEEVKHVGRLLENLHYYFTVTLSRILQSMQVNPNWEVIDAITYWRTRQNCIVNNLAKGNAHLLTPGDFQPKYPAFLNRDKIWQEKV